MHRAYLHAGLVAKVLTVQCSPCLMYSVVDVDVDIVKKIVILVPVRVILEFRCLNSADGSVLLIQ